jgi:hypothetical protein
MANPERAWHKHTSCFSEAAAAKKKSFITLTPGVNVIKLFSFIADDEA